MRSCRSFAEKPCWDYYTKQVEFCKSPGDNLIQFFQLSEGWSIEPHLWRTLHYTLLDESNLNSMRIQYGPSDSATKALHLAWNIASTRGWTMSKHSAPPEANAKVLKPTRNAADTAIRATAADEMKRQHENVLLLENAVHAVADAKTLWRDCLFLQTQPIRVMWEFFRRDRYDPRSPLGRHLLSGMLGILPDNKIAEDIHADLRLASKGILSRARAYFQTFFSPGGSAPWTPQLIGLRPP